MLQPVFAVRIWVLLTCLRKFIIIWCLLVFRCPFIVVSVTQFFLASRNLLSWQMCRMWHYHICCGVVEKKECLFPLGERICSCSLLPCMLLGTLQMNICSLVIWICWVNDFSHTVIFISASPCVLPISLPFSGRCSVKNALSYLLRKPHSPLKMKWEEKQTNKKHFGVSKLSDRCTDFWEDQRNLIQRRLNTSHRIVRITYIRKTPTLSVQRIWKT